MQFQGQTVWISPDADWLAKNRGQLSPVEWQDRINTAGPSNYNSQTHMFHTERTLPDGSLPPGVDPWVEKPEDTPDGFVAWGSGSLMLPTTDPRVGGAGGGTAPTAAAAIPDAPAAPRTLQDILMASLSQRNASTGLPSLYATWAGGREPIAQQYDVEGIPIPLPTSDIATKALAGGGAISAASAADLAQIPPYVAAPAGTAVGTGGGPSPGSDEPDLSSSLPPPSPDPNLCPDGTPKHLVPGPGPGGLIMGCDPQHPGTGGGDKGSPKKFIADPALGSQVKVQPLNSGDTVPPYPIVPTSGDVSLTRNFLPSDLYTKLTGTNYSPISGSW